MLEYLRVGKIANTHGLRGEIKVVPTTEDPARFQDLKDVYIQTMKRRIPAKVKGVKYLNRFVVLKLEGYDNIDQALTIKNADLYVARADAIELPKGAHFVGDLIGCQIVDADSQEIYGTIGDVLFTGANDVYVVKRDAQKDLLIPVIDQCVVEKRVEEGVIYVRLLKGLLTL